MAFVQLGCAGERAVKLRKRYAQGFRESALAREHVAWRERMERAES